MENSETLADAELVALIDAVDIRAGAQLRKAKQYSIDCLRQEGYSDAQIEKLLNVKL